MRMHRDRVTRVLSASSGQSSGVAQSLVGATSFSAATSLEEVLANPARRNKSRLDPTRKDPNSKWFQVDKEVTSALSASYKKYFPGPYRNMAMVPNEVKDQWFIDFAQKFYWYRHDHDKIRKCWERTIGKLISTIISKAKRFNKKPKWPSDANWCMMQEHWNSSVRKQRSKRTKKIRESEQLVVDLEVTTTQKCIESQESFNNVQAKANHETHEEYVQSYKGNSYGMGTIHHFKWLGMSQPTSVPPPVDDSKIREEIADLRVTMGQRIAEIKALIVLVSELVEKRFPTPAPSTATPANPSL